VCQATEFSPGRGIKQIQYCRYVLRERRLVLVILYGWITKAGTHLKRDRGCDPWKTRAASECGPSVHMDPH